MTGTSTQLLGASAEFRWGRFVVALILLGAMALLTAASASETEPAAPEAQPGTDLEDMASSATYGTDGTVSAGAQTSFNVSIAAFVLLIGGYGVWIVWQHKRARRAAAVRIASGPSEAPRYDSVEDDPDNPFRKRVESESREHVE